MCLPGDPCVDVWGPEMAIVYGQTTRTLEMAVRRGWCAGLEGEPLQ